METRETIRKLSIHTAIWNIFKWIPELLNDETINMHWEYRVMLKTNFELFKNSTLAPVFEQTRLDQMHTLGSAVWVELTMLTNCMQLLSGLIWSFPGGSNPFKACADKHFAIRDATSDVVMYHIDGIAAEMTAELKKMEVWT